MNECTAKPLLVYLLQTWPLSVGWLFISVCKTSVDWTYMLMFPVHSEFLQLLVRHFGAWLCLNHPSAVTILSSVNTGSDLRDMWTGHIENLFIRNGNKNHPKWWSANIRWSCQNVIVWHSLLTRQLHLFQCGFGTHLQQLLAECHALRLRKNIPKQDPSGVIKWAC